jgi:acylphosphatase
MTGTNEVRRRYLVSGRVQGVWFRASTAAQAKRLGITGYARNLPDKRVEVLACGAEDAVARLEQWLRTGPPGARVDSIESAEAEVQAPEQFQTQ